MIEREAARWNIRHRERDPGEQAAYRDAVAAVTELGRKMAQLQVLVEGGV